MKKQLIRPTFDRILVKQIEAKTEEGKIIIPEGAQEAPPEGVIVAIGPGVITAGHEAAMLDAFISDGGNADQFLDHQTFDVGQHVSFGKYAGSTVVVNNNEQYRLLRQDEITYVVVESEGE